MTKKLEEDLKQIRNRFGSDLIFTIGCNNAGPFIIRAERILAPAPVEEFPLEEENNEYIG